MGEKKRRYKCRDGGTLLTTVSLLSPSPTYTHLTLSCWSPSVWSCSERTTLPSGRLTAVGKGNTCAQSHKNTCTCKCTRHTGTRTNPNLYDIMHMHTPSTSYSHSQTHPHPHTHTTHINNCSLSRTGQYSDALAQHKHCHSMSSCTPLTSRPNTACSFASSSSSKNILTSNKPQ